tara:strand:+ start:1043 stop:1669 length:627 start_codon:yes stop_codon:yes gene_type:complete
MTLLNKSGSCKICNRIGYTEWHHIISQHHSIKTGQRHLLKNPNNVIELCKKCHNQTTASMVRKRLTRKYGKITSRPRKKPLTAQEKRILREKKQLEEEKKIERSMEKLVARGAGVWLEKNDARRTIKRFRRLHLLSRGRRLVNSLNVLGIEMIHLYPPDHWNHSPLDYSPSFSKRFERDWLWTLRGGAIQKSEIERYRSRHIARWMKR